MFSLFIVEKQTVCRAKFGVIGGIGRIKGDGVGELAQTFLLLPF
jgi:hypothetical protein